MMSTYSCIPLGRAFRSPRRQRTPWIAFSIMPRTAFITGATGFVGTNVVNCLLRDGWEITALARANSKTDALNQRGVKCVEGVLWDAKSVANAMPHNVDCVFHIAATMAAWKPREAEQWQTNVDGTQAVIDAALQCNAKRVIEDTTPRDGDKSAVHYFRSKHAAEERVRDAIAKRNLPAVIIQPSAIIGPHDTTGFARVIMMVNEGKLQGIPPGAAAFCYGPSVAEAIVAAADKGRIGEHYILPGENSTFHNLLLGKTETRGPMPLWLLKIIGRVSDFISWFTHKEPEMSYEVVLMVSYQSSVKSTKAAKELGYQALTLDEMLPPTLDWLRQEHYI
ncbi:hypothetical protein AC1031_000140 [Aphanomyces cochlioides]|nr:hypothetical protein AC1031_000140 [Aphanomyces cochlioides]